MINVITQFVCDWCEDVYESDLVGAEAIHDAVDNGWRNDSGKDFCSELCFDKHFAREQEKQRLPKPPEGWAVLEVIPGAGKGRRVTLHKIGATFPPILVTGSGSDLTDAMAEAAKCAAIVDSVAYRVHDDHTSRRDHEPEMILVEWRTPDGPDCKIFDMQSQAFKFVEMLFALNEVNGNRFSDIEYRSNHHRMVP